MTRRQLLAIAAGCSWKPGFAAPQLPGLYYRQYSRCLPDHLAALARAAYQRRNQDLALLTTPAAVAKRQKWARETFWKLVGGEPERTPLNARVTGKFEREGYYVEKVVYESRPRLFVSANLYVPSTGKPPYSGVVFQMGHSGNGKASSVYQKSCQGLARLGYIVLAFDPMGQGERIFYPDASNTRTRLASSDDEHSHPGKQFLLLGDSSSRFQVWDAVRSLDYLAAHPLVDPQRLASTGQSGGGTLTMLLACVDSRLSAAVVSSGNTENFACANFNPPGSTDDAEQDFLGSGRLAWDRWDLLYPIAPKPLKILVSARDFFGTYSPRYLSDGSEEYEKLAKVYKLLGHRERLDWGATPLPHGLTYGMRLQVYNWFERWLKNSDRKIEEEPPTAPEPDRTLWAGPAGNVVRDFGSLRPIDLIREQARALKPSTSASSWKEALQVNAPLKGSKVVRLGRTPTDDATIEGVEFQSASDVWLPAWLYTPKNADAGSSTLLMLDERGRNQNSMEGGLCHRLCRGGHVICAPDLRGIGDARPEISRGNPAYAIEHGSEENFAWASLILGEPLLGQWVTDILVIAQALRNDSTGGGRLVIAARGWVAVPALFAFAASALADSLYLTGSLASYQTLLEAENYRQSLANFAWDLFRQTDLPLLAASASPRRIHIAGALDGAGNTMQAGAVRAIYANARNVAISSDPAWDEGSLLTALNA